MSEYLAEMRRLPGLDRKIAITPALSEEQIEAVREHELAQPLGSRITAVAKVTLPGRAPFTEITYCNDDLRLNNPDGNLYIAVQGVLAAACQSGSVGSVAARIYGRGEGTLLSPDEASEVASASVILDTSEAS